MKTAWILTAAIGALTACGPLSNNDALSTFAGTVGARVTGGDSPVATAIDVSSREQIEAQPADLLRVSLIDFGTTSVLVKTGENAGKVTWFSQDQLSFTFKDGLLIGTRGLPDDLMGSDIDAAIASLDGGGNHLRMLDFLNDLDQIQRVEFTCTTTLEGTETLTIFEQTYETVILEELCNSEIGAFKNTYWRDAGGVIWQSRQFISVDGGYLGYQRL